MILDEATSALDPKMEKQILLTLKELNNQGLTIISISHQPAIKGIANVSYMIENGELKKTKQTKES